MRILGFLFLVVIVLAVVGWFRGWFTISTVQAGEAVTVRVDEGKIRDDSRAAADGIADTSSRIAAVVKSIGQRTTSDESVLHGTITAVDAVERDLTVHVDSGNDIASTMLRVRVPGAISMTRSGTGVAFDQVRSGTRVKLTFADSGEDRRLTKVELLH